LERAREQRHGHAGGLEQAAAHGNAARGRPLVDRRGTEAELSVDAAPSGRPCPPTRPGAERLPGPRVSCARSVRSRRRAGAPREVSDGPGRRRGARKPESVDGRPDAARLVRAVVGDDHGAERARSIRPTMPRRERTERTRPERTNRPHRHFLGGADGPGAPGFVVGGFGFGPGGAAFGGGGCGAGFGCPGAGLGGSAAWTEERGEGFIVLRLRGRRDGAGVLSRHRTHSYVRSGTLSTSARSPAPRLPGVPPTDPS
jgi:hypothetical protein